MTPEHAPQNAPFILIYQDLVNNNHLLFQSLRTLYGRAAVDYCTPDDILAGRLAPPVRLLIMPGGEDLYYAEKLNGAGNRAIRAFVEAGGRYLGICAGAYYACAQIAWAQGTPHEITGPRELGFFTGTATGPIADIWNGSNQSAALDENGDPLPRLIPLSFKAAEGSEQHAEVIYYGGPAFSQSPDSMKNVEILAHWAGSKSGHEPGYEPGHDPSCGPGHGSYRDPEHAAEHALPMILKIPQGQGLAILCAAHPEIGARELALLAYETNHSAQTLRPLAQRMQDPKIEDRRNALWTAVLTHLDIG